MLLGNRLTNSPDNNSQHGTVMLSLLSEYAGWMYFPNTAVLLKGDDSAVHGSIRLHDLELISCCPFQ